ncbi:MAG TPA: PA14 domain-containing protein, partial [Gemmata sp.]|nr:PA14 domain-containing protein [Gemmata sp.]
ADRVTMYHCRFFNAGEQLVKSSAGGDGVDDCRLEYCLLEFTNGPSVIDHGGGTGYTGGLHAHEVDRWLIANNLFRNFHNPDNVQHTFAPVVLMWNHSADTIVEGNTFIDCDRAVAFGLIDQATGTDHRGGIIRNNFVYQRPGLFTQARHDNSDGELLVYDSPDTQVYHNTVLTNGNSRFSIEARWLTTGVAFDDNLADAPLNTRDGGTYTASGNYLSATASMFLDPASGDLHLEDNAETRANVIDRAVSRVDAISDFDLAARPTGEAADIGADELPGVVVHGLAATYFDNRNFNGATVTRIDPQVNFVWNKSPAPGIRGDTFSVIWQGQVEALYSERYTFYTRSDNGVRLWVNGRLLIRNWTSHTSTEDHASIRLVAGQRYDIRMDYYDNTGVAVARLLWSSPSQRKQVIPTQHLFNTPGSPSALAVAGRTSSTIQLTWTDASPNETGFRIERSTDGIFFAPVATVGAGIAFFEDSGLTSKTTYYYRARAFNDVGESLPTPAVKTATL